MCVCPYETCMPASLQLNSLFCPSHRVSHKIQAIMAKLKHTTQCLVAGFSFLIYSHLLNGARKKAAKQLRYDIKYIQASKGNIFPSIFPSLCLSAAPFCLSFLFPSCSLFLQAQSNLPLPFPQGNKGRNANDYSNPSCHRNAVM